MFKHYFKTAWRSLIRNKLFSAINIGGLAVGMSVAILIGFWIKEEVSYNTYFKHYDTIAQVMQNQTVEGKIYTQMANPFPLSKTLQLKYGSNFKHVVISSWQGDHILNKGLKSISESGMYMDKGADEMLSLKMIYGKYGGLKDPHSILLSASTAKAMFGNVNPLDQQIKIDNKLEVKVTGVYEDIPFNTDFNNLNFIAPWDLYVFDQKWIQDDRNEWDDNSFQIFVQFSDNVKIYEANQRVANAKYNEVSEGLKKFHPQVVLMPMSDWHLHNNWENGKQTGGAIIYIKLFCIIGIFVLLLACINFMNLSTARSEKRAKEVGIRKAVGSARSGIIKQFYFESILLTIIAFFIALLFVKLLLPWFNGISGKQMSIPWGNIFFWLISLLFIGITGVIAGSYPALYLSSFNPVKVLKGTFRVGKNAALPRKILIVIQFAVSLILIIGTCVVYKQIRFSQKRDLGYNKNNLIAVYMKTPEFFGKYDVLRNELMRKNAIENMAETSSPMTGLWSSSNSFNWEGKDPTLAQDFGVIRVTHDFGKTVNWQLKEGRDFSRSYVSDSSALIINEAAAKYMGLKNPIGTIVRWGSDSNASAYKIIGIAKNMLTESPYQSTRQTFYMLNYENANWMLMRLNPKMNMQKSLKEIGDTFKKYILSAPFEYQFVDKEFSKKFEDEERVGKLATFFAVLAVFISCLGLFGLASFMAEQKTKEIGIRKVLGASVFGLWKLLSKDFILLVLISCFIAAPIAWFSMYKWLQKYQYRTTITWWVFIVPAMFAIVITLITVSYHAIRAARANPVKSLKME
ncbi:MAG: ABC transporter permease [Arachidicoccus sp.]|nr:ABC transporter permease [Arachidicoccus sp.]